MTTTYLAELIGTFGEREYLLTAGAFITIPLPLVVFFSLQRYFVRGPDRRQRQGIGRLRTDRSRPGRTRPGRCPGPTAADPRR